MNASDHRSSARQALTGNWLAAVITTLVAALLGASIDGFSFNFTTGSTASSSGNGQSILGNRSVYESISEWSSQSAAFSTAAILLGSLAVIYILISLFIGSSASLGLCVFNLNLHERREKPSFSQLFARFNIWGSAIVLQLLRLLFTFLWSLLFIIPGIIAAYSYAMSSFILAENPDMPASEALRQSKEMMRGHRFDLFLLQLSFIGWAILCLFTAGLGFLWLNPYVNASEASFYLELRRRQPGFNGGSTYETTAI
ncbi:MAG: DUF975 family protein [Oscillospiraceae bacterium]|nr:DUF975 family protein [Oscillospiraceae bacterium]MDD4367815.1 DUF975 family protein [Oscillospiraceae bacterium]